MESTRHCAICDREQVFEQPECLDGHDECPDWVCTSCGFAVVSGWTAGGVPVAARRGRSVA